MEVGTRERRGTAATWERRLRTRRACEHGAERGPAHARACGRGRESLPSPFSPSPLPPSLPSSTTRSWASRTLLPRAPRGCRHRLEAPPPWWGADSNSRSSSREARRDATPGLGPPGRGRVIMMIPRKAGLRAYAHGGDTGRAASPRTAPGWGLGPPPRVLKDGVPDRGRCGPGAGGGCVCGHRMVIFYNRIARRERASF